MRKNSRKLKPNPSNNQRSNYNIRSSSIRDIIGDRRFNDQFSRVNTHGNEGIKKVKRTKADDTKADDISDVSYVQCEATEDPRLRCGGCCNDSMAPGCYEDFSAKTSEYAFFKKLKENTCREVRPNNPHNHPNNVQQSDHFTGKDIPNVQKENIKQRHHFTREEIPTAQKENTKHVRFSSPIENEQDDAQYSSFSTPCVPKNSEENNIFGADITNVQNVKSGAYNWLTLSMGSKSKNSRDKGVFCMKREKLRNLVANNNSLYDVNEVSSNGFDLISALISRLLPPDQKNSSGRDPVLCQDQTDPKYKGNEDHKRKLIDTHNASYLDDDFSRSTKRHINTDLAEWHPTGHAPKSIIQYNRRHTEASKESLIEYPHISYMDDGFYSSVERHVDMYNPTCSEESFLGGHSPKCSTHHNHGRTEYGFRNPNFDIDSILSFDESRNLHELETSHFHNGPKLLELPQTLLLGWEDNTQNDKFQLSAFDSQTEINPFSPSSTSPSFMSSPPSYPHMNRYLKHEHLLSSSIIPYTPKHHTTEEDCNTWCMNGSLKENPHSGSESFLFLIQSPTDNILRFNSFAVNDENEENFGYRSDEFSEGWVKAYGSSSYTVSFDDRDFDNIKYPLLLHDSGWIE